MSHLERDEVYQVIHRRGLKEIPNHVPHVAKDKLPELDNSDYTVNEEVFRRDILSLLNEPEVSNESSAT